ncbi:MAG: hypothetical protein Q4C71_02350 [Microbacteriaceae bacterium]|nr:hypothetical protein [Microbacteriaceae bacterium]
MSNKVSYDTWRKMVEPLPPEEGYRYRRIKRPAPMPTAFQTFAAFAVRALIFVIAPLLGLISLYLWFNTEGERRFVEQHMAKHGCGIVEADKTQSYYRLVIQHNRERPETYEGRKMPMCKNNGQMVYGDFVARKLGPGPEPIYMVQNVSPTPTSRVDTQGRRHYDHNSSAVEVRGELQSITGQKSEFPYTYMPYAKTQAEEEFARLGSARQHKLFKPAFMLFAGSVVSAGVLYVLLKVSRRRARKAADSAAIAQYRNAVGRGASDYSHSGNYGNFSKSGRLDRSGSSGNLAGSGNFGSSADAGSAFEPGSDSTNPFSR